MPQRPNKGKNHNSHKAKIKKSKNKHNGYILPIIIAIAILGIIICVFKKPVLNTYYEHKLSQSAAEREPVISEGVTVMGYDVSGMTKEKAVKKLNKKFPEPKADYAYRLISNDNKYTYEISFEDIGYDYDIEKTADEAIAFGNTKLSETWFRDFKILESGSVDFTILKYDYISIKKLVNSIAKEVDIPLKDASVKRVGGKFALTKSSIGYEVDKEKLINDIIASINNLDFGKDIIFDINTKLPKYKEEDFADIDNIIGAYSSSYTRDDDNRIKNLDNACKKINGTVVYPGDEFSANEKFNPCTEENGWRNAGTIVNGVIEDSIGGGMCQISSGLYMAALEAELKITERHNHSIKVNYMPYAFDAALAGDYKDLRFINDTDKPIYIEAYLTNSKVNIKIYGKEIHSSNRHIEFENKYISTQEPGEPIMKNDDTLPEGAEQTDVSPLDGQTYELYKKVYENDKLVETVKINTSIYVPRREVILVGTRTD